MRAVTVATAAVILGLERKALDNVLNRLAGDVIPRGRQGVERRIPVSLLEQLLLATEISTQFGAPIREALATAQRLTEGETAAGPFLELRADLTALRAELDRQMEVAIESVVRRPRGRPRKR